MIREGFRSIKTHGLMSFATVTIIMACLIIMGSVALLSLNINYLIKDLEKQNEVVDFVDDEIEDEEEAKVITPDIKAAFDLIVSCEGEGFQPPEFDSFYVDVNHKLRHHTMRLCGIEDNGKLAALAMTVAESDTAAVLGAVACAPEYRRKRYGSAVVKHITNSLVAEGKRVYLHRAQNANVRFYQKLGFTECGQWREYHI